MTYIPFKTILLIKWIDSISTESWKAKDEIYLAKIDGFESVGYFVMEGKDSIMIAQNIADDMISMTMQIPKKSIVTIKELIVPGGKNNVK